jgi:hypothetical protein
MNKKIRVKNKPICIDKEGWHFIVKHCHLLIEVNNCEDVKNNVKK